VSDGSVQIVGGSLWRQEVKRRIGKGRKRLKPFLEDPAFTAYAKRVLGDRFAELAGNP